MGYGGGVEELVRDGGMDNYSLGVDGEDSVMDEGDGVVMGRADGGVHVLDGDGVLLVMAGGMGIWGLWWVGGG